MTPQDPSQSLNDETSFDHSRHPATAIETSTARKSKRRPLRRAILAVSLIVLIAAGGGAAWAVDRFLIPKVEIADVASYEASHSVVTSAPEQSTDAGSSELSDEVPTLTDTEYVSGSNSVSISRSVSGSGDDTVTYYVADVTLGDATSLRSAFAQNQFGQNITDTTSSIAAAHDAVFAINGDYYGFRDTGIIIRNGVIYRDEPARAGFAFYTDGSVKVYDETQTSADELLAAGVWNTLSFGPALLEEGEVVAGIDEAEVDTNFGNHSIQGNQPRTAVGMIAENHFVFVVVDGRNPGYSKGVTLTELAGIMQGLGATTAYNIDGGGSSTMYFGGDVVNQVSNGGERGTSDILYVAG